MDKLGIDKAVIGGMSMGGPIVFSMYPTLVLVGLSDAVYSCEISQRMHEAIPNSTLAITLGASHAAVFEAPDNAAAAIADWSRNLKKQ